MLGLQEIQNWLKVAGDDDVLRDLEARAVAFLEQETGRYFGAHEAAAHVERLSGNGMDVLWLSDVPVVDHATLADPVIEEWTGSEWEIVEAADYSIEGAALYREDDGCWAAGRRNFRATYFRGYTADQAEAAKLTDAPGDIRQAVLDLVAVKHRTRGKEGLEREAIGGYSYALADIDAVPGLASTIDRWRWRVVG